MDFSWLGSPEFIGAGVGLGAIGDIATNIFNYKQQQTAFDYQKTLNERIMEREDTALQRRMEDAKKAGVNPYAVVGQSAGAGGSVSAPNAPQMKSGGTIDAMRTALAAYSTVSEVQKRKQEVMNLEIENQNKQKEGLILDADLAGKLNTNKILGYNADNAFMDLQRNIAGFNFDFGAYYDYKDGKLRNKNDQVDLTYGTHLEWTPYGLGKMRDNEYKLLRNIAKSNENNAFWDLYGLDVGRKSMELAFYPQMAYTQHLVDKATILKDIETMQEIAARTQATRTKEELDRKELEWYDTNNAIDAGTGILNYLLSLLKFTMGNAK